MNGDMNQSCRQSDAMLDGVVMHDATAGGGEPRDLQIALANRGPTKAAHQPAVN
jgi:hypothetical protein